MSSFDLVNELANTHVNNGFKLCSLDVVSLFMNVPTEMVLDSISRRWDYIVRNCKITKSEFFIAVKLILNSTFFVFNGKIYQQTFGVPKALHSPLSPIAADIVLQDLETKALEILKYCPPFYKRYIDDVTLAAPSALLQHTLDVFNSFHPRLQFTIEIGEDDTLNFLEITMLLKDNRLTFDWFHKPTFSGRYLNYWSQHPVCQKRGTVIGIEFNHNFDWSNAEILDNEPYYYKRLISEMLCIKRQVNGLNLQTDTEGLPDSYLSVIEKLSKI
ncbi:uncharacterized protein [Temnothorax nylanderi]|uniref:uncharacterized protein n=1 Tax=Temnothorax nylanderi TaxID=102681 RepID=UPI003A83740B